MATDPTFAATIRTGSGLIPGTADTSLTGPTNVTTILTAGASGTRIEEITFQGVATTVAGVVNVFAYDGSTYHLYDQVLVRAVTSSTTAVAFQARRIYSSFWLPTTWSLRVTGTIAGNTSGIKVSVMAGDY